MMQIKTKDADEAAFFWMQKGVEFQSCEVRTDYNRKSLWFAFNMDMTEGEFQQLRNDFRNGKTLASLVGSKTWVDTNYQTSETSTGVYVSGGNSPYLLATGNKSYAGEYRLYSGTASSNTSVWKDIEHDWYIVHVTTDYSPWYIRGDSTPSDNNTYAQIANNNYGKSYNNSDGADVVFAGGYTYDDYKTYYYAS